jgi:hypothetical protein
MGRAAHSLVNKLHTLTADNIIDRVKSGTRRGEYNKRAAREKSWPRRVINVQYIVHLGPWKSVIKKMTNIVESEFEANFFII